MGDALIELGLKADHLIGDGEKPTMLGSNLHAYFEYRADALYNVARPHLMDTARAKGIFEELKASLAPRCPVPMNKQKGDKRTEAYFTGIVNMLIESNAESLPCDYNPGKLTSVTVDGAPLRTLARRLDGAFPTTVNPIAVWEVKEYYNTTSFGSRVADGIYESILDGMELEELREHERIDVKHYLMVDAYDTWWGKGRSYLCRIVDMLHMGYVDEVLFGSEVLDRLPEIVKSWVVLARERESSNVVASLKTKRDE
jgi:hypothetical protein